MFSCQDFVVAKTLNHIFVRILSNSDKEKGNISTQAGAMIRDKSGHALQVRRLQTLMTSAFAFSSQQIWICSRMHASILFSTSSTFLTGSSASKWSYDFDLLNIWTEEMREVSKQDKLELGELYTGEESLSFDKLRCIENSFVIPGLYLNRMTIYAV